MVRVNASWALHMKGEAHLSPFAALSFPDLKKVPIYCLVDIDILSAVDKVDTILILQEHCTHSKEGTWTILREFRYPNRISDPDMIWLRKQEKA